MLHYLKLIKILWLPILTVFLNPISAIEHNQHNDKTIGVFCSADDKIPQDFKHTAFKLGQLIAKNNLTLVTGGSKTGLMKAVIDGFAENHDNNNLFGVIPEALKPFNINHPSIPANNLAWTNTIHERLAIFAQKCHSLVILPGGFGTLHELMDFLVHQQFGLIKKQIILINTNNYWTPLLQQFNTMLAANALQDKHLAHLAIVASVEECISQLISQNNAASNHGLNARYWEKKS